jgi:DNA-binding NarL/FixJ family response regulator
LTNRETRLTRSEFLNVRRNNLLEDIEWLAESGLTIEQIAGRLNLTAKNVEVTVRRHASDDLLRRLSRNRKRGWQ